MSSLWTNYKPPATAEDIDAAVSGWMLMLRDIPNARVHQKILRFSAEGAEFAPQVGQIYRAVSEELERDAVLYEAHKRLCQVNRERRLLDSGEHKEEDCI